MSINLGRIQVKIFAQVGDAEPYELGRVSVPLRAQVNGKGFTVDLDGPFSDVKALVEHIFTDEGDAS